MDIIWRFMAACASKILKPGGLKLRRASALAASLVVMMMVLPAQAQKSDPPPIFMSSAPEEHTADRSGFSAAALGSAGVFTGLTVGVPIKISRTITSESRRMTATLIDDFGGNGTIMEKLLAASFGIPYGIASGTVLGSIRGVQRAIKFGYERPFSRESFSLIEPEE